MPNILNDAEQVAALRITCPTCAAAPGEACWSLLRGGETGAPHKDRVGLIRWQLAP